MLRADVRVLNEWQILRFTSETDLPEMVVSAETVMAMVNCNACMAVDVSECVVQIGGGGGGGMTLYQTKHSAHVSAHQQIYSHGSSSSLLVD